MCISYIESATAPLNPPNRCSRTSDASQIRSALGRQSNLQVLKGAGFIVRCPRAPVKFAGALGRRFYSAVPQGATWMCQCSRVPLLRAVVANKPSVHFPAESYWHWWALHVQALPLPVAILTQASIALSFTLSLSFCCCVSHVNGKDKGNDDGKDKGSGKGKGY